MLTFPRNSPSPSHVSLCECCWNLVTSPQLTSDFSHSPYQGPFELTVPHIFPHLLMTFSQATYCINAAQMKSGHLYSDFHNGGGGGPYVLQPTLLQVDDPAGFLQDSQRSLNDASLYGLLLPPSLPTLTPSSLFCYLGSSPKNGLHSSPCLRLSLGRNSN